MKKNRKILYAACALFLVSVLFSTAALTFGGIKGIAWNRALRNREASQDMEKKWQEMEKTRVDWQNIENEYGSFCREYVLQEEDFASFRSNLETMIESNHLQRKGISYTLNEIGSLKLKYYKVNLNITGDYPSMKKLIFDIESMKHLVFLTQIILNQEKSQLSGIIELETYFAE